MFKFRDKELSISVKDLTDKERDLAMTLMNMGDSQELALWTIEHQERVKDELYKGAYNGSI